MTYSIKHFIGLLLFFTLVGLEGNAQFRLIESLLDGDNNAYTIVGSYQTDLDVTTRYQVSSSTYLINPRWTADGGTVVRAWYASGKYHAEIKWSTTGYKNIKFYRDRTVQLASIEIAVKPANTSISGSTKVPEGNEETYFHSGKGYTDNYFWEVTGGTVINENKTARSIKIRWTIQGIKSLQLKYKISPLSTRLFTNTYTIGTRSIAVTPPAIQGKKQVLHGESVTYTHTGQQSGTLYHWQVDGGTILSENKSTKQVTVRWTSVHQKSIALKYGSTPQRALSVVINAPLIKGSTSVLPNDQKTYTHTGGYTSSSYRWQVTGGTIIGPSAPANSKSVEVRWNASGGQLKLYHGTSLLKSLTVSAPALSISGNTRPQHGQTEEYTHNGGGVSADYSWSTPAGIVTSTGDDKINLQWTSAGQHTLRLHYRGNLVREIQATVTPVTISGDQQTQTNKPYTYSHDAAGAYAQYTWTAQGGKIISEDAHAREVTVVWEDPDGILTINNGELDLTILHTTNHPAPFIRAPRGTNLKSNTGLELMTTTTFHTYQWYKDKQPVPSNNAQILEISQPGDYFLKGTLPSGFELTSNTIRIIDELFWDQDKNMQVTHLIQQPGIVSRDELRTLTKAQAAVAVHYFDGLGRTIQTVHKEASAQGKDMVQPYAYDYRGRISKNYLPYQANQSSGHYRDLALESDLYLNNYNESEQQLFYAEATAGIAQDTAPYAETIYEDTPRGRVLEQGSVGADWQPGSGHTARYHYSYNTGHQVRRWNTSGVSSDYYPANTLRITRMTDENGHLVKTYTDTRGLTVLEQVEDAPGHYLDTYHLYDEVGRLIYTVPPKAATANTWDVTDPTIAELLFSYRYDYRGRLVEKKVPGAQPEYIVYDQLDRVVLTQNASLRAANQWIYIKYDRRQRPVYTGVYTNTVQTTRLAVQELLDVLDYDQTDRWYEERSTASEGYTNQTFPTQDIELLTVSYYDDYDFDRDGTADYTYDADHLTGQDAAPYRYTRELVTGSKRRILGTDTWLTSTLFYDQYGQVIQTQSDNHLGGTDRNTVVYDFNGRVLHTKSTHHAAQVTWTDLVGVSYSNNILKKTIPGDAWYVAGAASANILEAGQDGWMEFEVLETDKKRMMGLSAANTDNNWQSINYALYLNPSGKAEVRESGSGTKATVPMHTGDLFRITRTGGQITYSKNGTVFYTSTVSSTTDLIADVAMGYEGSTAYNVRVSFTDKVETTNRYTYDHIGRVLALYQTNGDDPEQLIATYTYNALGQVQKKDLHQRTDGSYLQTVDYAYNIRGWLKSINDPDAITSDQLFGMELYYNDQMGGLGQTAAYNGNISGMKWKEHYGNGVAHDTKGYSYTYDAMDRLTSADYGESTNFTAKSNRYALDQLTYDANGNIEQLQRSGVDPTTHQMALIDDLSYTYAGNTVQQVEDRGTAAGFDQQASQATEYTYDAAGNMTADANKGITSITYNILDKPEVVTFDDGTVITYTYDATGAKLTQQTNSEGTLTTQEYVGSMRYRDGKLESFTHPEGRVVYHQGDYEYQYAYTDHLGNVRMLYTAEARIATFIATMESAPDLQQDDALYQNIQPANAVAHPASTSHQKSYKMAPGHIAGPAISLPVYPGDRIELSVQGFYTGVVDNSTVALDALISAVAGAFGGATGAGASEAQQATYRSVDNALGVIGSNTVETDQVAAYLNYILFDKTMTPIQWGYEPMEDGANGVAQLMRIDPAVTATEEGIIYVYLTNESNTEVYFDDMNVTIHQSNVIQNTNYYPFGLQHDNSWTRPDDLKNNYLYNGGAELNEKTRHYETLYRDYDPALGRFHQIDPLASSFSSWTPYQYAFNSPSTYNDPYGDQPRRGDGPFLRERAEQPERIPGRAGSGGLRVPGRISPHSSNGVFAKYGIVGADYSNPYAPGSFLYNDFVNYQMEAARYGNSSALKHFGASSYSFSNLTSEQKSKLGNAFKYGSVAIGEDGKLDFTTVAIAANGGPGQLTNYSIQLDQNGGSKPCETCGWNFLVGVEGEISAGIQGGFQVGKLGAANVDVASFILAKGSINNLEGAKNGKNGKPRIKQGFALGYIAGLSYEHSFDYASDRANKSQNETHEIKLGLTFFSGALLFDSNWNLKNAFVGFDGEIGAAFLIGAKGAIKIGANYKSR